MSSDDNYPNIDSGMGDHDESANADVPSPLLARYEVSFFVGPCSDQKAEALAEAILDLDEFKSVGGGAVGMERI